MPDSIDNIPSPNVPVVTIKDGTAIADSRDIARAFGKQHKNVLQKIDQLLADAPELHGLNFKPMILEVSVGKGAVRHDRAFEMDRKGFSLVAMRFTGAKALQWQIAYVDEFERMESALRGGGPAMVEGFNPSARSTLGGIMKRVTHAELEQALVQTLPRLIEPFFERLFAERFMSQRIGIVHGIRALEVADLLGFNKGNRPKGLSQFISGHLTRWHRDRQMPIQRDGLFGTKLFNEASCRAWINAGGREAVMRYVMEKKGQGKFPFTLHAAPIGLPA